MTDEPRTPDSDTADHPRQGAIGAVIGGTLGPVSATVATVATAVDDTRFALRLSVGGTMFGGGTGYDSSEGTSIEIEDADEVCTDEGPDGAAGGMTGDAEEFGLDR